MSLTIRRLSAFFLGFNLVYGKAVYGQEIIEVTEHQFDGDLGFADSYAPSVARSNSRSNHLVPYANFEYENFFGRIDTFGVKIVPFEYGNIEVVTRFIDDGYSPSATINGEYNHRESSVPFGIGTLQITPIGGFLINTFHDFNKSGAGMVDVIFAEQFDWGRFTFYPQAGAEYRSHKYVQYFYGISSIEAARTQTMTFQPGAATNLFVDLLAETKISGNWLISTNFRRTKLDNSISKSPLVARRFNDNGLISLCYRF